MKCSRWGGGKGTIPCTAARRTPIASTQVSAATKLAGKLGNYRWFGLSRERQRSVLVQARLVWCQTSETLPAANLVHCSGRRLALASRSHSNQRLNGRNG